MFCTIAYVNSTMCMQGRFISVKVILLHHRVLLHDSLIDKCSDVSGYAFLSKFFTNNPYLNIRHQLPRRFIVDGYSCFTVFYEREWTELHLLRDTLRRSLPMLRIRVYCISKHWAFISLSKIAWILLELSTPHAYRNFFCVSSSVGHLRFPLPLVDRIQSRSNE